MLFMVVERYRHGAGPVYTRATERGRMLPEGLYYRDSWVDARSLELCFQLMETEDESLFEAWYAAWDDLVAFERFPVLSSAQAASAASNDEAPGIH